MKNKSMVKHRITAGLMAAVILFGAVGSAMPAMAQEITEEVSQKIDDAQIDVIVNGECETTSVQGEIEEQSGEEQSSDIAEETELDTQYAADAGGNEYISSEAAIEEETTRIVETQSAVFNEEYYSVEFHVDAEWTQGYNATITITNTCEKNIDNWYLDFTLDDDIINLQCGTIIEHENNRYLVKNAGWNQDIPVGGSVYFTFTALKNTETITVPQEYSMNTAVIDVDESMYTSDFIIQSDWGAGFTSCLVLTNISNTVISDWKVFFDFAGNISMITGGEIVSSSNGQYIVENLSYNQQIAPGQSLSIQIIGNRDNTSVVPQNIVLKTVEYCTEIELPKDNKEVIYFRRDDALAEVDRIKSINGGNLPQMYLDKEDYVASFIGGKYSDINVIDYDSAVQSLKDITAIMCIDWETCSFEGVSLETYKNRKYYRLQQMYKNIEVAGKQLIVATDENGVITSLSGDFDPLYDIDMMVNVDENEASAIASNASGVELSEGVLKLYSIEPGYNELAWYYKTGEYYVVVSAAFGDVLVNESTEMNQTVDYQTDEGIIHVNQTDDGMLEAKDIGRNIEVYNLNGNSAGIDNNSKIMTLSGNEEDIKKAEKALLYSSKIYDYVGNVLGMLSYGGNSENIKIFINGSKNNVGEKNAYTNIEKMQGSNYGRIMFTTDMPVTFDVMAHEYFHLIEKYCDNNDVQHGTQIKGVYEAYSDVFAEMVQFYYGCNDTPWQNPNRDIVEFMFVKDNKSDNMIRSNVSYEYVMEKCKKGEDGLLGQHEISLIISNILYNIFEGHDGYKAYSDNESTMEWMYRSLKYLSPSSNYDDCYIALMQAAGDMGFSDDRIASIKSAFDNAGFELKDYMSMFDEIAYEIIVNDAAANIRIQSNVVVTCKNVATNYTQTMYNDFAVNAVEGKYIITVMAKGYVTATYYLDTADCVENRITIGLIEDENGVEKPEVISGTVINVTTGIGKPNVIVRLRCGINCTEGRYYRQDGKNALTCITDEEGRYSFSNVPIGYYTVNASTAGYITANRDIVSVSKDVMESLGSKIESDRTIYIFPRSDSNQYRIVLTWGANPTDLDAHLSCRFAGDEQYHIYFGDRRYYKNGEQIAVLDVDDTEGYGPETMTVSMDDKYDYCYFVHWFYGDGTWQDSNVKVVIYKGNREYKTVDITNTDIGYSPSGGNWHVFDINNGEFTLINRVETYPKH